MTFGFWPDRLRWRGDGVCLAVAQPTDPPCSMEILRVRSARFGAVATLVGVMSEFEDVYREVHPRLVSTLAAVSGDRELAIDAADEAASDWSSRGGSSGLAFQDASGSR